MHVFTSWARRVMHAGLVSFVLTVSAVLLGCGEARDDGDAAGAEEPVTVEMETEKCSREDLEEVIDGYLGGLSDHDAGALVVSPALKFTENGDVLELGEGFWQTAGEVKFHRNLLDPGRCGAVVQAVVEEEDKLVIFGLRLQLEDGELTEIESLVVRKGPFGGEASFQPQTIIDTPQPTWEEPVPAGERGSREELYAAAKAYCEGFNTSGSDNYAPPPFADDCNRWENGVKTTNNNCAAQFENIAFGELTSGITRQRYPVADVENGIAVVFAVFSGIGIDFHMFKVKAGLIHEIQAVVQTPFDGDTGWEELE